jgi:hypothetical protein
MKKFKLFFIAIAVIAIGSAFATSTLIQDEYVRLGEDNFILKSSAPGLCFPANPSDVCTWVPKSEVSNPQNDEDFEPAETQGLGFIYVQ